jgi:hypothetical protein
MQCMPYGFDPRVSVAPCSSPENSIHYLKVSSSFGKERENKIKSFFLAFVTQQENSIASNAQRLSR